MLENSLFNLTSKGVEKFVNEYNKYVTKKEEHFVKRCWEMRHIGAALKEEHFTRRCWEIRQWVKRNISLKGLENSSVGKEEHFTKRCWEIRQWVKRNISLKGVGKFVK